VDIADVTFRILICDAGSVLVLPDSMVHRLQSNNLPADPMWSTLRAQLAPLVPNAVCVSCNSPIAPVSSNTMWSLICNHTLHLHCLQPLGYPIHCPSNGMSCLVFKGSILTCFFPLQMVSLVLVPGFVVVSEASKASSTMFDRLRDSKRLS